METPYNQRYANVTWECIEPSCKSDTRIFGKCYTFIRHINSEHNGYPRETYTGIYLPPFKMSDRDDPMGVYQISTKENKQAGGRWIRAVKNKIGSQRETKIAAQVKKRKREQREKERQEIRKREQELAEASEEDEYDVEQTNEDELLEIEGGMVEDHTFEEIEELINSYAQDEERNNEPVAGCSTASEQQKKTTSVNQRTEDTFGLNNNGAGQARQEEEITNQNDSEVNILPAASAWGWKIPLGTRIWRFVQSNALPWNKEDLVKRFNLKTGVEVGEIKLRVNIIMDTVRYVLDLVEGEVINGYGGTPGQIALDPVTLGKFAGNINQDEEEVDAETMLLSRRMNWPAEHVASLLIEHLDSQIPPFNAGELWKTLVGSHKDAPVMLLQEISMLIVSTIKHVSRSILEGGINVASAQTTPLGQFYVPYEWIYQLGMSENRHMVSKVKRCSNTVERETKRAKFNAKNTLTTSTSSGTGAGNRVDNNGLWM
jgi:hypothetical protein